MCCCSVFILKICIESNRDKHTVKWHNNLFTTATFLGPSRQSIHLLLFYTTTATSPKWKWPLKLIPTSHNNLLTMASCTVTDKQCIENPSFYREMSPFLIHTMHLCSLILSSFCFIDTFWFIYEKKKIAVPRKRKQVSHFTPYLPTPLYDSYFPQSPRWPLWRGLTTIYVICVLLVFTYHVIKSKNRNHSINKVTNKGYDRW